MIRPTVSRCGDAHLYSWPAPDYVEIEIDQVHHKGDLDWIGWLTVRTRAPGMSPHLLEGKHNLAAPQSRAGLARQLDSKMPGVQWTAALEMACILTIRAEKEGAPFEMIGSRPDDEQPPFVLEPVVRRGAVTTLFGPGGELKSTVAMLFGQLVSAGHAGHGFTPAIPGPVGYLDYETDAGDLDDTHKRVRRGLGVDVPDLFYRREVWPLHQTAAQWRRLIDREGIVMVIIDSIGAACGDDPEKAEPVIRFFSAVRSLGVAALCIDHVTHSDKGRPFGSVYKTNATRLTFEIRKQQGGADEDVHIGLYPRKANKGALIPPIGVAVSYADDAITFRREDIREPSLREGLPASQQIKLALQEGRQAMTIADIAEATGLKETIARARTQDLVKAGAVVIVPIRGMANKYALRTNREEGE